VCLSRFDWRKKLPQKHPISLSSRQKEKIKKSNLKKYISVNLAVLIPIKQVPIDSEHVAQSCDQNKKKSVAKGVLRDCPQIFGQIFGQN